jgi:hypothetical protein
VYEDWFRSTQQVTTLITPAGKFVGLEVDGRFVPADRLPPCCELPASCERPECWTRIGYIGPPD